ncbi:MAG TPA: polysaccharide deacetylase family protein [Bryobacteraceae bacterium]
MSAAKFAIRHTGGLALARWLNPRGVRILMYHHFWDRAALARQCAHIRKHYHPVSMTAVSEWLHAGRSLPPYALAVTVDDGHRDFHETGYPVFAEYGIPVTVYLVTDFMDGKSWLWFDRILHAFRQATRSAACIPLPDGKMFECKLESDASRRAAGQRLADLAVSWSEADRRKLVGDLSSLLQAEDPRQPPPEYQPLSWAAVRTLAASGVEFGAHTKTHPILSALADPQELWEEIAGSKARIEEELNRPVLHFCYPNGTMRDIGPAAAAAVQEAGLRTAVTAEPGLNHNHSDALLLRRIPVDPSQEDWYYRRLLTGWALQ